MNAIQESKQIVILNFSICGVPGFRTVAAKGSSVEKRMNSAINQMFKEMKKRVDKLQEQYGSRDSDKMAEASEPLSSTRFALHILTSVRDQAALQQDMSHLQPSLEDVTEITTEEFFARAEEIYAGNADRFIETVKEIDVGLDKHIAARIAAAGNPQRGDAVPYLFLVSGPFLGAESFPIVLTGRRVREMGDGDATKASQEACLRAICSVKNFRLTDYLRAETNKARAEIRDSIFVMDRCAERVEEITVEAKGPLMTPPQGPKAVSAKSGTIGKVGAALEFESDQRLMMHLIDLNKPVSVLKEQLAD